VSISIIIVIIKDYINGQLLLIMRLRQVLGLKTLCLRLLVKRSKVKKKQSIAVEFRGITRNDSFFSIFEHSTDKIRHFEAISN